MELPTPALADLDDLLSRLGGEEALVASARAHGAFRRARAVKSAIDLLRLALMYGPGGLSLRTAAAVAAEGGLCDLSDVALLKRLRRAAAWLEALCAEQIGLAGAALGEAAGAITLVDASVIQSPGTGTDYRLHLQWDVTQQRSLAARITTTAVGERLDRLSSTATCLLIGDRGYPQPDGLRNTLDAGAEVLVRLTWNSLSLTNRDGPPVDWLALCAQAQREGGVDIPVLVRKAHRRFEPLPMRLVFLPKPAAAAAQARKAAERASGKAQRKRIDPRTLACADHLILLTSLPVARFDARLLGALYRLRWQIELLFKRLKSLLHLDRLPAKDPALARTWLHAHLLIALLVEDCIADERAFPP
jgi:Transposase DDE domain